MRHFLNPFLICANALEARRAICRRERFEQTGDADADDDDDPRPRPSPPTGASGARAITQTRRLLTGSRSNITCSQKNGGTREPRGRLMLWLTEIHADALQNSWPEKPPQVTHTHPTPETSKPNSPKLPHKQVTRWTAAALTASATVNPVQVPLRRQLRRRACVVSKPADPMCPTCDELVKPDAEGKPTTTKCDH